MRKGSDPFMGGLLQRKGVRPLLVLLVVVAGCARTIRFEPHPTPEIPATPTAVVVAVPVPIPAPVAPVVSPPPAPERLTRGETLRYTVLWLGIAVLRGELRVAEQSIIFDKRPHLEAAAKIWSTGLVRRLFAVEDQLASLIQPQTVLPSQFQLTLHHRARVTTEAITFDHARRQAVSTTTKTETVVIPPQARDLLSTVYYLRTVELVEGRPVAAEIVANGRVWKLVATVRRQGMLTIPQGTFTVAEIEVQAEWLEQYVRHQTLRVWLTTDPTHTPLMVRIKIPVIGTLTALLDDRQPAWPPQRLKLRRIEL